MSNVHVDAGGNDLKVGTGCLAGLAAEMILNFMLFQSERASNRFLSFHQCLHFFH